MPKIASTPNHHWLFGSPVRISAASCCALLKSAAPGSSTAQAQAPAERGRAPLVIRINLRSAKRLRWRVGSTQCLRCGCQPHEGQEAPPELTPIKDGARQTRDARGCVGSATDDDDRCGPSSLRPRSIFANSRGFSEQTDCRVEQRLHEVRAPLNLVDQSRRPGCRQVIGKLEYFD